MITEKLLSDSRLSLTARLRIFPFLSASSRVNIMEELARCNNKDSRKINLYNDLSLVTLEFEYTIKFSSCRLEAWHIQVIAMTTTFPSDSKCVIGQNIKQERFKQHLSKQC